MMQRTTPVEDSYAWQAVREAATICPRPCDFDLLTLKVPRHHLQASAGGGAYRGGPPPTACY